MHIFVKARMGQPRGPSTTGLPERESMSMVGRLSVGSIFYQSSQITNLCIRLPMRTNWSFLTSSPKGTAFGVAELAPRISGPVGPLETAIRVIHIWFTKKKQQLSCY